MFFTEIKDKTNTIIKEMVIIKGLLFKRVEIKSIMYEPNSKCITYKPKDTEPSSFINRLIFPSPFKYFGEILSKNIIAIIAVNPRYAYCNKEIGIIGILGIQYGSECIFQNHAKTAHNTNSIDKNSGIIV